MIFYLLIRVNKYIEYLNLYKLINEIKYFLILQI